MPPMPASTCPLGASLYTVAGGEGWGGGGVGEGMTCRHDALQRCHYSATPTAPTVIVEVVGEGSSVTELHITTTATITNNTFTTTSAPSELPITTTTDGSTELAVSCHYYIFIAVC